MSGFLLDTNIPSEIIKTNPNPRVNSWALTQENAMLHISVISIGELRRGIQRKGVAGDAASRQPMGRTERSPAACGTTS